MTWRHSAARCLFSSALFTLYIAVPKTHYFCSGFEMHFTKTWKASKAEVKKCSIWWECFVSLNLKFCSIHSFYFYYNLLWILNLMQNQKYGRSPFRWALNEAWSIILKCYISFLAEFIVITIFQIFKEKVFRCFWLIGVFRHGQTFIRRIMSKYP